MPILLEAGALVATTCDTRTSKLFLLLVAEGEAMKHWHCGRCGNQGQLFNLDWDLNRWYVGFDFDALGVWLHFLCLTIVYWRAECRQTYREARAQQLAEGKR